MIRPMITSLVNPDAGGNGGGSNLYALLNVNYDYASFTPVTASNTDIISAHFINEPTSNTSTKYLLGSAGSAYINIRGTDGRLRLADDAGLLSTFSSIAELLDGNQHYVEFRISPSGVALWVDNALRSSVTNSPTAFTFDVIGARSSSSGYTSNGSVFGVTLGNQASWAMASPSFTINTVDSIGSNNLTFVNAPVSPVESDFIGVTP
tara:strand:- start:1243 stop:1863 length:621 start_codon:yes stop_codon:yes gene_type:complete